MSNEPSLKAMPVILHAFMLDVAAGDIIIAIDEIIL